MREIQIRNTDRTPSITFNPTTGYICIAGKAIPENASQYFRPIVDGLGEFVKDPTPEVTIDLQLEYINTASLNILLELLKEFEIPESAGVCEVVINWQCDPDDDDMIECGHDVKEFLSGLTVNVLKVGPED